MRMALSKGPAPLQGPAVLFTSTEAVDVLTCALQREGLGPELPGAIALCVHERIAQAASSAGWRDVRRCAAEEGALLAALSAGGGPGPAGPLYRSNGIDPDYVA
jgi:uroporphyrinogen-III synthase